jgi:predicted O-methyltransferase YrrM
MITQIRQEFSRPIFGWLGLRPPRSGHALSERDVIQRWATGRHRLVEIGVAEGSSARVARSVMASDGVLWLVDPYFPGRLGRLRLNPMKALAHREVNRVSKGQVTWIEKLSWDAVRDWREPIDYLFIDADHSYEAVQKDWEYWSVHVAPGGVVLFHDAREWEGGWTNSSTGPVRLVNERFRADQVHEWEIVEEQMSTVVVMRAR